MAEHSSIQWTDNTFNPWRGCTRVSEGCRNCYAERQARRNPKVLGVWGPKGTRVLASEGQWKEALRWNNIAEHDGQRPRVFCASIADIMEDWQGQMTDSQGRPLWQGTRCMEEQHGWYIPETTGTEPYMLFHARERLWDWIAATPCLTWLLLTKRPENFGRFMPHGHWPNVWLGTSVESQAEKWRIDALSEAPQKVAGRFLSCEPLLGPLDIWDAVKGVQWVIVGGESGGAARPMRLAWVYSLVEQAHDAKVSVFVKQLGRKPILRGEGSSYFDQVAVIDRSHGSEPQDWPEDLRIRDLPAFRRP